MKFENVNALYCDPNAYIKAPQKHEKKTKKIVFQEPYENLPNFYLNNGFKKHGCNCVCNPIKHNKHDDKCCNNSKDFHGDNSCENFKNQPCDDYKLEQCNDCNQNKNIKPSKPVFDIKNLLPFLSGLTKGNGGLGNIISMLGANASGKENGNNSLDFSNIIQTFLKNGGGLNLFNMFSGNGKTKNINKIKSTDFEIENYTRVE